MELRSYDASGLSSEHALVSRFLLVLVGLAAVGVHTLLFALDVTLGSPRRIVYPYSPVAVLRFISVCKAMGLVIPLMAGVWLVGSGREGGSCGNVAALALGARKRFLGGVLFGVGYAGLVIWTLVGNPVGWAEHQFNMVSPSQDGAFLIEARSIDSVGAYLRAYPELARRDSDRLRGLRVLSNTPGISLLAYSVRMLNDWLPGFFDRMERGVLGDEADVDDPNREIAEGACMVAALTALWGMSIVFAYGLARLWWTPMTAVVVAVACVFTPSSVIFSPGKDPAQLFTTLGMLYFWFRGCRGADPASALGARKGAWACAAAGAASVVGAMVGLVHVWIAGIGLVATVWSMGLSWERQRTLLVRCVSPAVVGAVIVAVFAYLLWGWSIPATVVATARRYLEVQHDVLISPFHHNLMGGGIFVLLLGPAFWMLSVMGVVRRSRDEAGRLGRCVVVVTGAVMLCTYVFAQNAEVARLWVVFIPLLVWGAALLALSPGTESPRRRAVLTAVLACQLVGTMSQWSMMDARGTEDRVLSGRYFDD